jgi:hypothetical protein
MLSRVGSTSVLARSASSPLFNAPQLRNMALSRKWFTPGATGILGTGMKIGNVMQAEEKKQVRLRGRSPALSQRPRDPSGPPTSLSDACFPSTSTHNTFLCRRACLPGPLRSSTRK